MMMNIVKKFDVNDVRVELYRPYELPVLRSEAYENSRPAAGLHWPEQTVPVSGGVLAAYPNNMGFIEGGAVDKPTANASLSSVTIQRKNNLHTAQSVTLKDFNFVFFRDIAKILDVKFKYHSNTNKVEILGI